MSVQTLWDCCALYCAPTLCSRHVVSGAAPSRAASCKDDRAGRRRPRNARRQPRDLLRHPVFRLDAPGDGSHLDAGGHTRDRRRRHRLGPGESASGRLAFVYHADRAYACSRNCRHRCHFRDSARLRGSPDCSGIDTKSERSLRQESLPSRSRSGCGPCH